MKMINLLAVSTAKNTTKILDRIIEQSKGRINLTLHFGDSTSDFKASSLVRMNTRVGRLGHIFERNKNFSGVDHQLMASKSFHKDLEIFIDQLYRHSDSYRYKSHNLKNLQDYLDYYHILADAIAEEIRSHEINHVLFFNIPHLAYDTIIYQIALALKINVTIVTQSLFPNKFFSLQLIESYGDLNQDNKQKKYSPHKIPTLNLFYMKKIKQEKENPGIINLKTVVNFILFMIFKKPLIVFRPVYVWHIFSRIRKIYQSFPKWRDPFADFFHVDELAYFEHLAEFESSDFNFNDRFVYFPLPMQPEMTTSPIGGNYRDQVLAIEQLSQILPKDVKIFVKENPKQGSYARGPLFFHRLSRIPSVVFVPSFANTRELTEKSLFVATATGTVGWESICLGKSVLVFGYAWYRNFPGVSEFRKGISFDDIRRNRPKIEEIESCYSQLMELSHEGVVDRAYTHLVEKFDATKNSRNTAKVIEDLILKKEKPTFSSNSQA